MSYRPLQYVRRFNQSAAFPLWLKLIVTFFYIFISHGVWEQYSALNFLWFSHIGFMGTVVALWLENRLLASMMLLNSFIADGVGWTFDLLVALVSGRHPFGATAYMFDAAIPLTMRLLSLFHVVVPALLAWMVYKLRYDGRAIVLQTLLAWAVLVICVLLTDPVMNINCVYGPGTKRQVFMPEWLYFVTLLLYVPLGLYLPVHLTVVRALKWTYEKPAT